MLVTYKDTTYKENFAFFEKILSEPLGKIFTDRKKSVISNHWFDIVFALFHGLFLKVEVLHFKLQAFSFLFPNVLFDIYNCKTDVCSNLQNLGCISRLEAPILQKKKFFF